MSIEQRQIPENLSENSEAAEPSGTDLQQAGRAGLAPSIQLRRHFVALARKVKRWAAPCGRPIKIGVTSLDRRVGKSTVAFNLSSALTRIEGDRVLLVEADFGKHFVSRRMGRAGAPGLSEILTTGLNPVDCILDSPIKDLSVLGSGHISEQESVEMPFDLLGPVLDNSFDDFGYLVFDLPVANDLTSCYSILPNIDGVMIVVDSGKIDKKQIKRARQRLAGCGAELMGLVINQA